MYWGITCPLYGISFFLPSIIKDLGYTSSTAQLLTVPIYITAAVVAIGAAWLSDRRKQRSPFLLFFMSLIAIGFIVVIASSGRGAPGVVYLGVFIAVVGTFYLLYLLCKFDNLMCSCSTLGIYPAFPGNVTWIAVNLAGDYKRAAGMALHIGLGNMAGGNLKSFFYFAEYTRPSSSLSVVPKANVFRIRQQWHPTSTVHRMRPSTSSVTLWSSGFVSLELLPCLFYVGHTKL